MTGLPRVLVLTDRYPPYCNGGYEIACHAVAERLRERGSDVAVLTSNHGLSRGGVDGHVRRLLHCPQNSPSLLTLARWEHSDHRMLRRTIKSWRPSIVYAWSMLHLFPSLYLTLRELKVPLVLNIQDFWLPRQLAASVRRHQAWESPAAGRLERIAKRTVHAALKWRRPNWLRPVTIDDVDLEHVVFCSRFRQRQHAREGLPLGDSRVVYNGVDPDRFHGKPSAPRDGRLRVLFAGRLVHEKGAHTAVEAMSRLVSRAGRRITLDIAGGRAHPLDYSATLEKMIRGNDLQGHVRFLGMIPNQQLPDVYRRHDVMVFPSIGDEGFPLSVLEAMASGLTVVGTTTGGTGEILQDGVNGLTFPPGDHVALAGCLERLFENRDLARSLASEGQRLVRRKFHIDAITDETLEHLTDLAG